MTKPDRLVLIRHGDDPPDDRVSTFAERNGFAVEVLRPFRGDDLGVVDGSVVGTVVYGGPFEVYETRRYPFLLDEHRWIEACMASDVPLLGICQGAQSIAHVLGAAVGPPQHGGGEFGYYEIRPTTAGTDFLPEPMFVAQSHFHGFETPPGAVNLASSPTFPHQAFRFATRTYGLQFHPEVTIEGFRRWQDAPWARYDRPGAQTREEQNRLMHLHDATQDRWFTGFLERLLLDPGQER